MEEIKVGEFVRTANGYIDKVTDRQIYSARMNGKHDYFLKLERKQRFGFSIETIKNHSFDIIDLIEEGDYVNGKRVVELYIDGNDKKLWFRSNEKSNDTWKDNKEIKSIVTKEQFKAMEYEVK